MIKYVILVIWIVGLIATLAYYDYLIWMKPSKFKENMIQSVKDWYPFANFWRRWFNSIFYLWMVRVICTALSIGIFFLILMLLLTASGWLNGR